MPVARTLPSGLLLVALVACSGGGGDADRATTTGPAAATTTIEPSFSGAGGERFCAEAQQAEVELARLVQVPNSPEAARDVFVSAARALDSLVESAPAEIKPDVEVIAAAYGDLIGELEGVGWDPQRIPAEITARLDQPDVTTAGGRLDVYEHKVCGVDPDRGGGSG